MILTSMNVAPQTYVVMNTKNVTILSALILVPVGLDILRPKMGLVQVCQILYYNVNF